jgi:RecA-family ATPase
MITPLRNEDTGRPPPTPPYSLNAEQALLGALLIENRAYLKVSAFLRPEHFGEAALGRIYTAIGTLIERGELANPITLGPLFDQDEALSKIGGAKYLFGLAKATPTLLNTEDYGRHILELYQRRQAIAILEDALDVAYRPDLERSAASVIADYTGRLSKIADLAGRLRLVDPASLSGLVVPERQWLVAPWIPMRRATGFYGAPGSGKTLLMQMLATACAIGKPWLGLPVRRCKSILHFCEDDLEEMHLRQDAINRHYHCTFDDLGDIRWFPRLGEDNTLMPFDRGEAALTALFHELVGEARRFGAGLVVEDTLADIFGGREIERGHARRFVQESLGRLARDTGAAVIACAHPSLTGLKTDTGSSGSTGWEGTFRARLYVSYPKDEDAEPANSNARVLTRKKANWASVGETIEMHWAEDVFVADKVPIGIIDRRKAESIFLDLLDKTSRENQPVSSSSNATNYAPRLFEKRPEREGYKKKDFEKAMQSLFAGRVIANREYGRKSDQRYRIVRIDEAAE